MACSFTDLIATRFRRDHASVGAVLRLIALASVIVAAAAVPAHAATKKHAAMAIDANTGKVLHNASGDELRHPASLTKMMTLYLTFERIEAGKLSYDSRISFSEYCVGKPPSKLDLDAGESIRVIDAIKALVTKSANDAACALAENIGGSEIRFARMMTDKARAIGMSRTVYRNASGLPDDEQVTTARDQLTLALRLQDDFPKHYELFSTRSFSFRGKTYRNHNKLLGQLRGVDGIKTGYIRASGFNLVTSVRRDGKHVVAAVFGGRTASTRNAEMTSLIYQALKKGSTEKTRKPMLVAEPKAVKRPAAAAAPRQVAEAPKRSVVDVPREERRPEPQVTIARLRPAEIEPAPAPAPEPRVPRQEEPSDKIGRTPGTLQDQLAMLLARSGVAEGDAGDDEGSRDDEPIAQTAPAPQPAARMAAVSPAPARGPFQVQIGAYDSLKEAEQNLAALLRNSRDLLGSYVPVTEPVASGSKTLYRARFAGFDAAAAETTCSKLKSRKIDCFVTSAR